MALEFVGGRKGFSPNSYVTIPLTGLTGGIGAQALAGDLVIVATGYAGGLAGDTTGVYPEYGYTRIASVGEAAATSYRIGLVVDAKKLAVDEAECVARGSLNPTSTLAYRPVMGYTVHVWRGAKEVPSDLVTALYTGQTTVDPPPVNVPSDGVAVVIAAAALGEVSSSNWDVHPALSGRFLGGDLGYRYDALVGIGYTPANGVYDPPAWPGGGTYLKTSSASVVLSLDSYGEDRLGSVDFAGSAEFSAHPMRNISGKAVWSAESELTARSPRPGVVWESFAVSEMTASAAFALGGDLAAEASSVMSAAPSVIYSNWVDDAHGIASETILPYNATDLERDLERPGFRLDAQPVPIERLWNPDTCPPQFLPWLAWALSVDTWDPGWPDATKREVIRTSVMVHRKKGTLGAIKLALQSAGIPTEIREWWEEGGTPHTFRLLVDAGALMMRGQAFTASLMAQIKGVIDPVKPVRSHYAIYAYFGVDAEYYLGAVLATNARLRTHPYVPTKLRGEWTWAPVSVGVWRAAMGLRPAPITQEV